MKIHAFDCWNLPKKEMTKLHKSLNAEYLAGRGWIVISEGTYTFATQTDAEQKRQQLRETGVFTSVFHFRDITW